MNKLPKPVLVAIVIAFCIFVIAPITIGITGDVYDLNHGLLWISFAKRIQWESILAGALGLAGGLFVIYSTRQTLRQAKLHRADDLNGPLQLARDAVDDLWTWSNTTIDHLEGLFEQVESGHQELKKLNSAIDNAYVKAADRARHISSICKEHKTKALSFELYSRLEMVAVLDGMRPRDPGGQPEGDHYIRYRKNREFLQEARTRSAGARTAIDQQIKVNLIRCGVDD
ncbi:hypothetical protein AUP42_01470 [Thalassospira lucentensis]|uniref:Uncharacterized protein n=1 Tax=Thalassospira lucentensis TaxID=168935 RepID=A0A154L789_9PROT|nr:hypothetical protein [Thalassospira lucentensis]KZB64592.1 hypothetical protein AUP42_01470 [Thalassospira lucentensis]